MFVCAIYIYIYVQLSEIEQVGYEAILMVCNKTTGMMRTLGTEEGHKFVDANRKVPMEFGNFIAGGNQLTTVIDKSIVQSLRSMTLM